MAPKTKILMMGSSMWIPLAGDMIDHLDLSEGDEIYFAPTPDGLLLAAPGSDLANALDASGEFMRRYPAAMQALAE